MVYCFDLDGTLCNTDGNNYKDSTPKKERIEIVNTLYDQGHTILIDTARGCVSGKNYFSSNKNFMAFYVCLLLKFNELICYNIN